MQIYLAMILLYRKCRYRHRVAIFDDASVEPDSSMD